MHRQRQAGRRRHHVAFVTKVEGLQVQGDSDIAPGQALDESNDLDSASPSPERTPSTDIDAGAHPLATPTRQSPAAAPSPAPAPTPIGLTDDLSTTSAQFLVDAGAFVEKGEIACGGQDAFHSELTKALTGGDSGADAPSPSPTFDSSGNDDESSPTPSG